MRHHDEEHHGGATSTDPNLGDCPSQDGARLDLSFVVETVNLGHPGNFAPLETALAALRNQTLPRDRYEILVVADSEFQPDLRVYLERTAPDVRVITSPRAHYYAQKNAGARAARGRIVGYVDADCDPVPGWGEAVVCAFDRNEPTLVAVQGRYDTPSSRSSPIAQAFLVTIFGHQAAATERRVPSLAASNCALRREELCARPFAEDPFFHGPDLEKAAEIRTRGGTILLVPEATNSHDHEPGLRAQHVRGAYWGYSFLRLRREGRRRVPYARLFRALGPLAPLALVPAKAWIDLRRLAERRRDLRLGPLAVARCAALLAANSVSVGTGALRYTLGLRPPVPAQEARPPGTPVVTRTPSDLAPSSDSL